MHIVIARKTPSTVLLQDYTISTRDSFGVFHPTFAPRYNNSVRTNYAELLCMLVFILLYFQVNNGLSYLLLINCVQDLSDS